MMSVPGLPTRPVLHVEMKLLSTFGSHGAALWLGLAVALGGVSGTKAEDLTRYVSVKDFGAKCDGVTDDGTAIQKAINASLKIHLPAGICLLDSTVRLRAGTELRGEGMGVSIVKQS